jgi:hypothetical protein
MKYDKTQFKKHHRKLVWAYFWFSLLLLIGGIFGLATMARAALYFDGGIIVALVCLITASFTGGILGLPLTLALRLLLRPMAEEQEQWFDEGGVLWCRILRPATYPLMGRHSSDKSTWTGRFYAVSEISRIRATRTHIVVTGRIHCIKFEVCDTFLPELFENFNHLHLFWIEGIERRHSMVDTLEIPRNFLGEEKILGLDIAQYNRKAQTNADLQRIPETGVFNKMPWVRRNLGGLLAAIIILCIALSPVYEPIRAMMLNDAIREGDISAVRTVLFWPGDNEGAAIQGDYSLSLPPLARASGPHANLEIAELLIDKGASVNPQDVSDVPPLHAVCQYNPPEAIEIARLLIERGADIDQVYALNVPILQIYWEQEDAESMDRAYELFMLLVDAGASFDEYKSYMKGAALYLYARGGHLPILEYLISEKNFDVNQRDRLGRLALFGAVEGGNEDIVEYLLKNGADVTVTNYRDQTPLEYARSMGQTEIAAQIQAAGGS